MRFLFDFISPYAYLAFTQLPRVEASTGATFELVPVLFAGLLGAHGNIGPAEVPAKRRYVAIDMLRMADELGVTITIPPHHPFNPLLALRVASIAPAGAQRRAVVEALFDAVWCRGEAIDSEKGVLDALEGVIEDASALVKGAGESTAKLLLREHTERAIEEGVFGVPTVITEGELFWGADSLRHIERGWSRTDEQDALLERWERVTPSAVRKR